MAFGKKRRWRCRAGEQPTEFDRKIMYLENKGKLVPTRELIKTPEQIEGIRRAGVVNTGVLDEVAKHIRAGMSTLEIDEICMDYCRRHNATPACLGYEGFPKSVCTSINEVVCHGIPKETDRHSGGRRHHQRRFHDDCRWLFRRCCADVHHRKDHAREGKTRARGA